MEIKINKEIRNYTESIFFGLSMRQFIFSVLACSIAVGIYFLLKEYIGTEMLSWLCILGAIPFGALGFFKYNGMSADQFVVAWVKSEILTPKVLYFKAENIYEGILKEEYKKIEKGEIKIESDKKKRKRNGKSTKKCSKNNSYRKNI